MEGPTPVSALIHAATMVTAACSCLPLSPMFELARRARGRHLRRRRDAFFAATVGTVQTDIKRVIAYSTCSQLGYMFFAAGVGAYGAAMFHLFTHAFFKALLFLGAGLGDPRDAPRAGHALLWRAPKRIPITFWAMIRHARHHRRRDPLGVFGFAGYYSKDAMIERAYGGGTRGGIAFFVGVFAALLTSFYSWRLMFLTF